MRSIVNSCKATMHQIDTSTNMCVHVAFMDRSVFRKQYYNTVSNRLYLAFDAQVCWQFLQRYNLITTSAEPDGTISIIRLNQSINQQSF